MRLVILLSAFFWFVNASSHLEEICKNINSPQNGEISGDRTPSPIEVNTCIDLKKRSKGACSFDVSICNTKCLYGYESDDANCAISCDCKFEGLFEGDIRFDRDDIPTLIEAYEEPPQDAVKGYGKSAPKWDEKRINGRVKIPYVITSSMSSSAKNSINQAIVKYSKDTCIDFVSRSNEKDYLQFESRGGCWSFVGKKGGKQTISIGRGCEWVGIVQHEILHALGFWHEQSRPDRDNFISVQLQNVQPNMVHNFQKRFDINSMGSAYDKKSVMHYGGYAFSNNNKPTIVDKTTSKAIVSQRQDLSASDKFQVNKAYQCSGGGVVPPPTTAQWGTWYSWGSCSKTCGSGTQSRTRKCMNGNAVVSSSQCTSGLSSEKRVCKKTSCVTSQWSAWASWNACSKTCDRGYQWRSRVCHASTIYQRCKGSAWQVRQCNTEECAPEKGFEMFGSKVINLQVKFCSYGNLFLADFNGDKATDVMCIYSDGWTEIMNGGGKQSYNSVSWKGMMSNCDKDSQVGDFNGDGSDDLLCFNRKKKNIEVTFSSNGEFDRIPNVSGSLKSFCEGYGDKISTADINNDGKSDLLCMKRAGGVTIYINQYKK